MFFVGQKVFVEKGDDVLILFNQRDGKIDLPGGKIQVNEAIDKALVRELEEELGSDVKIEVGEPFIRWTTEMYYGKNIGKKILLIGFKGKYISGEIDLSDEHSGYKWVDKDNYKELDDGSDKFEALEKCFDLKN